MQSLALVLLCLACMCNGLREQQDPLKTLAGLLQDLGPAAAFNPISLARRSHRGTFRTKSPVAISPKGIPTLAGLRPVLIDGETRLLPVVSMSAATTPKIIICGAPASGKGTQCEMLKEKYGVVHLSTGDMLRAAVADGTDVGKKAKSFMESGQLVPDEVIIGIVKDRLAEEDCEKCGWLLDGFPRTEEQAKALGAAGIEPTSVLYLDVPDEMLIERVVGRRSDPETGKIYHVKFSPPEDEEIAARLTQRADDTEEAVKVRLEAFHKHMGAVEAVYKDLLTKTDGTKSKEEVFKALAAALAAPAPAPAPAEKAKPKVEPAENPSLVTPDLNKYSEEQLAKELGLDPEAEAATLQRMINLGIANDCVECQKWMATQDPAGKGMSAPKAPELEDMRPTLDLDALLKKGTKYSDLLK